MKKFLLSLLILLISSINGVWAAGYTASLSANYELKGYKMKAFYNFTSSTACEGIAPTSGDLRQRDGFGIHNYGSGGRSATVNVPVSKDDILIVQVYDASTFNSISGGTKNETLTASTGYIVYTMTADATSETWSVYRYGGFVSAVVMEPDAESSTADYTIKYQDADGTTLKDDQVYTNGVVVGANYTASPADMASFLNSDETKKYIYVSGNETKTAAATNNTITLVFKEAVKYDYTVKNNLSDETIYSGTVWEGDNVTVTYPRYINVDGTLHTKAVNNNEYHEKFAVNKDNYQHVLNYTETNINNVVFFDEGESIFTSGDGSNASIRLSMEKGGYATEKTTFATLGAGVYKLVCENRCKGTIETPVHVFYAGENTILEAPGNGYNAIRESKEFVITETTEISMKGGENNNLVDWVYIQKVGEASYTKTLGSTGFGTFSASVNVTVPEGITVCNTTFDDETETLTATPSEATVIPANTGVIIKGNAETEYTFNATTDEASTVTTALAAAPNGIVSDGGIFGLLKNEKTFAIVNNGVSLAANSAYLAGQKSAKIRFVVNEGKADAIESITTKPADSNSYNVSGQRVDSSYKGIIIKNGKKYMNK